MKFSGAAIFFIIFFFSMIKPIYAQSSYVLPYPSAMPGSLSYKIHVIYENISKYWYFGDFGQFDYNLKLSDKYLVEAKTLFEYKQYLLGYKALKKSDQHFISIKPNLIMAEKNSKNIQQKKEILNSALQKHIEVIRRLKKESPSAFMWEPEKQPPINLELKKSFDESIRLRTNNL